MSLMLRLVLTAACTALAPTAQAQSVNVRAVTDEVLSAVCGPFARAPDVEAARSAAQGLGYAVTAQDPPRALTLTGRRQGEVRLSLIYGRGLCALGLAEGSVRTVAEAAAAHLEALGLSPVVSDPTGRPALVVWRGPDLQAVIAASPHHRPGVELVLETYSPAKNPGTASVAGP
ncbi:MAG: hypothetical protein ACT6RD_04255 [Brevundimonas sp.]|uniref:hypothetical protein n=1 Tax=Brevundimonas sp. TaxID=1871086 RepID=UPI004033452D